MIARTDFIFQALHAANSYVSMHRHRCYEIVYYRQGHGTTRIGRAEYRYAPHAYAIIRPETVHDETRIEATEVLCAGFRIQDSRLPQPDEGIFYDDEERTMERLLLSMRVEMTDKPDYYGMKLDLSMGEILIGHCRRNSRPVPEQPEEHIRFARNYIDEHYNENIGLERLAAMSGYSYHRFRHLFKLRYGQSPMKYMLSKRLDQARMLLAQTDLPASAVARRCGFATAAQFSTLFKRELGETPAGYRSRQ
ncbi:helix-turn-helix domain-containing protein [Cohnella sp. GCM10027633]|uniref:AraC family transcriptional regulator n=1 Tax=unclassified Cohnella TaxID=2636738 RepID=UPI00362FF701